MNKLSSRNRNVLLTFAIILMAGVAGIIVWQQVKNNEPVPKANTTLLNNCDQNVDCLYAAYQNDCESKNGIITSKTEDGDQSYVTVGIVSKDGQCELEVTIEYSRSLRNGDTPKQTYICKSLIKENGRLRANECSGNSAVTSILI